MFEATGMLLSRSSEKTEKLNFYQINPAGVCTHAILLAVMLLDDSGSVCAAHAVLCSPALPSAVRAVLPSVIRCAVF